MNKLNELERVLYLTLGKEEAKEMYKQALVEIMKTSLHTPSTLASFYKAYGRLPQ